MPHPADILKIAVLSFIGVFIINRGLAAVGLTSFEATNHG
jgi:hypothetical protein